MDKEPLAPTSSAPKPTDHPDLSTDQNKSSQQKLKTFQKLAIVLGVVILILLIVVAIFITRAFINDKTIQKAVSQGEQAGKAAQKDEDEKAFAASQNTDTRVYTSPDEYGGFKLTIPKYFSLEVTPSANGAMTGIAHPFVVDIKAVEQALRFEIKPTLFENARKTYDSLAKDKRNNLQVEDITVSGIKGVKFTGLIDQKNNLHGSVILLPVRDKTYILQTDNTQKYGDVFNQIVNQIQITP